MTRSTAPGNLCNGSVCCRFFTIISLLLLVALSTPLNRAETRLRGVRAAQEKAKAACVVEGDPTAVKLDTSLIIERSLTRRQSDLYEFTLSKGEYLTMVVTQKGIDVSLSLCGPDGNLISTVDRPNGTFGPEAISVIAQETGIYHLRVLALQSIGPQARYEFRIKAIRETRPGDDVRIRAERAVSEGNRFYDNGALDESIKYYKQAIELWHSLNDPYEESVSLYGIGWSYSDLGSRGMVKFPPLYRIRWSYDARDEHKQAVAYFKQAITIMQEINNRPGEAQAQAGIAWPYLYLGDQQSALSSFSRALELYRVLENPLGQAKALYGIGWVDALSGDDQKALDSFEQSRLLRGGDRLGEAMTLAGMGRSYNRLGKNSEAVDCFEHAFAIYNGLDNLHGKASALSDRGWVYYSIGHYQKAFDSFQQALAFRVGSKDSSGEANARYGIARAQAQMNKIADAFEQMKTVLDLIETIRIKGQSEDLRIFFFSNVQEYYEFYIDLAMRLHQQQPPSGYAALALWGSERARARELLQIWNKNFGPPPQTPAELRPLTVPEIQTLLDADTLLLEFFLGDERSFLWVMSANGSILSYQLPRRADLEVKALKMHQLMIERNKKAGAVAERVEREAKIDDDFQDVAADLSKILLGPAGAVLRGKKLAIVAPGALHLVPFAALPSPSASDKPPEPLIVNNELVYLPSASTLGRFKHRAEQTKSASKTLAILADPVFSKEDPRVQASPIKSELKGTAQERRPSDRELGDKDKMTDQPVAAVDTSSKLYRLPATRWEAHRIAALVPEESRLLALDFAANRTTAMSGILSNYRIVHFATHALTDSENPGLSRIVLSQVDERGRPQNGFLTIEDIYRLKLPAELIVTSACETGLGRYVRGEGIIGLTRAFFHAGALRIVVSLWPTNDRATAELMSRFYQKMLGPEAMAPSAALRAAQLELRREDRWKPAYFWAPFIIEGDWSPISR